MKPLERRIVDCLLNGKGLGKRKISKPFQQHADAPQLFTSRFYSMVIFPQNKFESIVSNFFERCLPGFSYITHKLPMKWLREQGWTIQETMYFNFFRWENFNYHAYAQTMHPFGYLERQRADAFIRRVNTLLPGIKAPEWAHNWRRAPEFDFESLENWEKATKDYYRDSTPMPHANYPIYFSVANYLNLRYQWGWYSQRFFYNEQLKGDYFHTGYYTKNDLEAMDSFYAGTNEGLQFIKDKKLSKEELDEKNKNINKWIALFTEFYPEFAKLKMNPRPVKIDEPYFERSADEVRNYLIGLKWTECLENGTFNQQEIQGIYEFFLHENTGNFWTHHDGQYQATELYNKFIKALGLPSVFELNKFTAKPVEHQYKDLFDVAHDITPYTVDSYRGNLESFLEAAKDAPKDVKKYVRRFITEEVYNPLFAKLVKTHYKLDNSNSSLVWRVLEKGDYKQLDTLNKLSAQSHDQLHFLWDKDVRASFERRMKEVVKTFNFVPHNVAI